MRGRVGAEPNGVSFSPRGAGEAPREIVRLPLPAMEGMG